MVNVKKVDLKSKNFTEDFKAELKNKFPQVFNEDKIDCEKLKLAIGEDIDIGRERFGMNWPGKIQAIRVAQEPSMATLKPDKEASVDFNTTENLFIEGDNLEVLKLLQKSYFGKIKMIYIDPPYNTGKEFIYPDKYAECLETYLQYTGQIDFQGKKFSTNTETDGRYHSKWMNMMWPRLFLARNLLTEDGVIFISIDDHEVDNLKKICNEVFGEENFIADITVVNNLKGRNDKKYIATANERLLMYVKSYEFEDQGLALPESRIDEFSELDELGKYRLLGLRKRGGADTRVQRPKMYFPIYVNPKNYTVSLNKTNDYHIEVLPKKSNGIDGCWRWGFTTVEEHMSWLIAKEVGAENRFDVFEKDYLETDGEMRRIKPKSVMAGPDYSTDSATKSFRSLMPDADFTNPKSVIFIKDLISYATSAKKNNIILDFFAGSGTTAHAVMQLNTENNSNRRFIMAQLPELTSEDSEAYRAGYKNIAQIGEERIRRAGKKILEENTDKLILEGEKKIDFGFKVYKLDKSNFNTWDGKENEGLQQKLLKHVNHIAPDSTEADILYELLLKSGYELTAKVEEIKIDKKKVYSISGGELIICLEKDIDKDLIKKTADLKPKQVICLNSGFKADSDLTNAAQIMKAKEIEFRTV